MMVSPSAKTAAIITLSVPNTVDPYCPLILTLAPLSPEGAVTFISPPFTSTSAPSASSPLKCKSMGRSPITHPPGRETKASPFRASIGPRTQTEALIFLTKSYGASAATLLALTMTLPLARSTSAPRVDKI